MAERVRTVSVCIEHLAFDIGHWCTACLLSTGVRQWLAVRANHGMHVQSRMHCHECGGTRVEVDPSVPPASWAGR